MATQKQIKAAKLVSENIRKAKPEPLGKVLQEAGYAESTSKRPSQVTSSDAWNDLLDKYLPDESLMEAHKNLLSSRRIEHMVFPLLITDEDIYALLASVNCTVKKISHGDAAVHCWFWSPDAAAQKAAIELAYKIKGRITNKIDAKVNGDMKVALVEFINSPDDIESS